MWLLIGKQYEENHSSISSKVIKLRDGISTNQLLLKTVSWILRLMIEWCDEVFYSTKFLLLNWINKRHDLWPTFIALQVGYVRQNSNLLSENVYIDWDTCGRVFVPISTFKIHCSHITFKEHRRGQWNFCIWEIISLASESKTSAAENRGWYQGHQKSKFEEKYWQKEVIQ